MYVVIFTSLFALFLTYQESIGKMRSGMKWGFILVTILGVIHYDYGSDYMAYYNLYDALVNSDVSFSSIFRLESILDEDSYRDPGWAFLCQLFDWFGGFFVMVAVLNIIQNVIVYRFIKFEVEKRWWALAIFVYLFVTSFYVLNFSMMRQGFVVCIFLGMWSYIKRRKWWIPLIVLFLCSTVHASAMIFIPFSFWGYLPVSKGRIWAVIYGGLFISLWFSSQLLDSIYESMMVIEEMDSYGETYENGEEVTFGLGYIIGLLPFLVSLLYIYQNKGDNQDKQLVMLYLFSFLITPFTQIVPLVSRVGYYFGIYQLAAIPLIFSSIRKVKIRFVFLSLWIFITLYSYWGFFTGGVYAESYRNFRTIFGLI